MKKAISCAFSVSMIGDREVRIQEVPEEEFLALLGSDFGSAVGHQTTADILSRRWGMPIPFARIRVKMDAETKLFVAVPQIRFNEAREFTDKEVREASFRFFICEEVKEEEEK